MVNDKNVTERIASLLKVISWSHFGEKLVHTARVLPPKIFWSQHPWILLRVLPHSPVFRKTNISNILTTYQSLLYVSKEFPHLSQLNLVLPLMYNSLLLKPFLSGNFLMNVCHSSFQGYFLGTTERDHMLLSHVDKKRTRTLWGHRMVIRGVLIHRVIVYAIGKLCHRWQNLPMIIGHLYNLGTFGSYRRFVIQIWLRFVMILLVFFLFWF